MLQVKVRVWNLTPERVAPSSAGEAKGGAELDRRTATQLTASVERMAGRGRKSRVLLVAWRVLVPMPSTVAAGETVIFVE